MLEINNLTSGYDEIDIIKNISIKMNKKECLFIIGPNGCGKSTFLKSIANLIKYRGSIKINGKEVSLVNRRDLAKMVGLMSQVSEIYFPYTVYETVSLGRYAYSKGIFKTSSEMDDKFILDSIERVGLIEYKDKLITELSGGQLQRVFLAKIFAQNPDIILLDEPTNHLDLKYQIELLEYVNKWAKDNEKIVIGVLHDLNLVHNFADSVIMLNEGKIELKGKAKDVLNNDKLQDVYGINIKEFMIETLRKWENK